MARQVRLRRPCEHNTLAHSILLTAGWVQVGVAAALPLTALLAMAWYLRRRRRRKAKTALAEE